MSSRIAKRYAKALFKLAGSNLAKAKEQRQSLQILRELFAVKEAANVLFSPVMPNSLKADLLHFGLARAPADDDIKHLIEAIVAAGRVSDLPEIIDAFGEMIDEAEGLVHAEVISAVPLTPEEDKDITAALSQILHKKVDVKPLVDSALLGGFVVRMGHYLVDLSLKAKLDGLAKGAVQDTFVKGRPS